MSNILSFNLPLLFFSRAEETPLIPESSTSTTSLTSSECADNEYTHDDEEKEVRTPRFFLRRMVTQESLTNYGDNNTPRILLGKIGKPDEPLTSDATTDATTDSGIWPRRLLKEKELRSPRRREENEEEEEKYERYFALNDFCLQVFKKWKKIQKNEKLLNELRETRQMLKSGKSEAGKLTVSQKLSLSKTISTLEVDEKKFKISRSVEFIDNELVINKKRFKKKRAVEAIKVTLEKIKEMRLLRCREFIDKEDHRIPLLDILNRILGTTRGKKMLERSNKELRADFTSLYCELNEWNQAKKKLKGIVRFYNKAHAMLDHLIEKLKKYQEAETYKLMKKSKFQVKINLEVAQQFLKEMGLDFFFDALPDETLTCMVQDLIKNPGKVFIPLETGYNEITIARDAFIKLKSSHIEHFEKLERDPFSFVKEPTLSMEITRNIMLMGKLYTTIRVHLFYIVKRNSYYSHYDSKKIKRLVEDLEKAMPARGDFESQHNWNMKKVFHILEEINTGGGHGQ